MRTGPATGRSGRGKGEPPGEPLARCHARGQPFRLEGDFGPDPCRATARPGSRDRPNTLSSAWGPRQSEAEVGRKDARAPPGARARYSFSHHAKGGGVIAPAHQGEGGGVIAPSHAAKGGGVIAPAQQGGARGRPACGVVRLAAGPRSGWDPLLGGTGGPCDLQLERYQGRRRNRPGPPRRCEGRPTVDRGAQAPRATWLARAGIGIAQAPPRRGLHDLG